MKALVTLVALLAATQALALLQCNQGPLTRNFGGGPAIDKGVNLGGSCGDRRVAVAFGEYRRGSLGHWFLLWLGLGPSGASVSIAGEGR